jgi:hypothetical protein
MTKKILIIFSLIVPLSFAQSDSTLILSEIMFFPVTGNNEFVELYNYSETESIDINGYKIKYSTSNPDIITDAGEGTILPPKSFAIILEGDYPFGSGIYDGLIPPEALVVKISDNAFGTTGMANTADRPVWLLSAADDTLETYIYSADNSQSFSDEKIQMIKDSSHSNWANSLVSNGTPGFTNSVTPVEFDLEMFSLTFSPVLPFEGDDVTISAKVKNRGTSIADDYSIEIYNDEDFDSTGTPGELIFSQNFLILPPGDSITATTILSSLLSGNYQIIAKVIFAPDENPANNELIKTFFVYPPGSSYNDVVINEIMYAPSTGEPEWVELYNRTAASVNIKQWQFSDNSATVTITNQDIEILPNSFIVLTRDSSILNFYDVQSAIIEFNLPALNNTGDAVVIKDSIGIIIDSLFYLPSWGGSSGGRSLERISVNDLSTDSLNWGTSTNPLKATPGYINSLTQKDFDIAVSDILFSPKFPVSGDDISISAKIKNIGLNNAAFDLQLFEDTNLDSIPDILIEIITGLNLTAGDSGIYDFNYSILNLQSKKGFYVRAEFNEDQDTTNNSLYRTIEPGYEQQSIVINEIMYAPAGGEPEWIELYNRTSEVINLNGWSVKDVYTTPVRAFITEDIFIEPAGFIVLSRSNAIFNYHRFIPSEVFVLTLPVLNNDADGVVLIDNRDAVIDSVLYSSQWGGTGGYSLERVSVDAGSNLQNNWGSSTDIEQSTPGRINSITPKQFDLSVAAMNFNPRFPVSGDDVYISTLIKNNGSASADNFSVEFYIDTDSNNVVDLLLSSESGLNLASGDSVSIISTSPIENLQSRISAAIRVIYADDEDTLNNYFERTIEPGFPEKVFVINEVMYNPSDDEPEWFELVNISGDSINLKDWSVSDIITPSKAFIINEDLYLQNEEFFIIAKDESFFNFHPGVTSKVLIVNFGILGNTSDGIIVYDFRDGIIDSLFYRSSWGGSKGISLERISVNEETNDSLNWTSSLSPAGSTPGVPNSIENAPDYDRNDLIINEIMFDPDADNSEFVEFVNISGKTLNIGGWRFEDERGNFSRLTESNYFLEPGDYFVVAADSSIFSNYSLSEKISIRNVSGLGLVNTGELILLKDVRGNIIDSVWYSDRWHNRNFSSTKNISLERINPKLNGNDPANWSSSADVFGATPAKQNSIFTENLSSESKITVSPNPFSPDDDGFEDFTIINYELTQATSQVRVKIFDSKGRLVRTLINSQASGPSGSIIFDGLGDDGQALRIGIYIIFLEAINEGSGVVETMKTVVVVARKL